MHLKITITNINILRNRMSKTIHKEPPNSNSSKINNSVIGGSFVKKANKSLVDPDGSDLIQLSQAEINFINTDPNEVYEINFTVRNVGQKSIKLKVKRPKSEYLSVSFDKDGNLAPGLDKKITVCFNSELNEQIKDRLFLYCEDEFEIQVPVCVYPVIHNLTYEPFINLGFIKVGTPKEYNIKFYNKGSKPAEIRLQGQFKGIKAIVEPSILTIPAQSQQSALLYVNSDEAVEFEGVIEISPQFLGESNIEVVGNYCEHSRLVTDAKGKQLTQVRVKPILGGQKWVSSFHLVNNTPKPCEFRIIRKRGFNRDDDQSTLITPEQFGREDEERTISFSSIEGEIEAYCKKEINYEITAKMDEHDQQLFCNYIAGKIKLLPYETKDWSHLISTTFKDQDSAKNLVIKGESIIPKISLSSVFMKFADCPLRSKQQKVLRIDNLSDRPITVTVQKSQNYSCMPETFEILKDGHKQVIIRFMPKVVGDLHQVCYLKVASFKFPIKMVGKGLFVKESRRSPTKDNLGSGVDLSNGVEVSVGDFDNTLLEQQISLINEKSIYVEEDSKISTTNYETSTLAHHHKAETKNVSKKRAVKNKNGKEVIIDIQNFNADKEVEDFPGIGRNPQEDRIVSRQLSLNEFKNIPVGPVVIDFGEIFISTAQTKTFHICNFNPKPISIQLEIKGNPQFEKSFKQVQVLPPDSHGGLKLVYEAIRQGPFKHTLQYIINGRHYFEILAVGSAILPTVLPSKTEFKFIAGEDDHTFEKKEVFVLNNTYPYEIEYTIQNDKESLFKVTPNKGKIEPNGKQNICIVHNFLGVPEGGGKLEQYIKIKVKNGKKIDLKCTSIIPESFLVCKPTQCNFKQISIYKQYEMKFSVKNSSKNFTIFKLIPNKDIEQQVSVSASKLMLSADEVAQITVKLASAKQQAIDSGITIVVRGGKKIYIAVKASVIAPKVKVEGEEINFGSMPVGGNPTSRQVTLINESTIPAEIELVLPFESYLYKCLNLKVDSNEQRIICPPRQVKQKKSKIFLIKLARRCKTQVVLEFEPEEVKQYKFMLPFYLAGSFQFNPNLQKNAICRSLRNKLLIDQKQIDFGKNIIEQSLDNIPKTIIFTLHNPLEESIEWWTHEKHLEPFSLDVKKGKIEPNSEVKVKALFYSETPGSFDKQLLFFVNNSDFQQSRPYLKVPIRAQANYPEIYFDRPYVILPTVGLNTESVSKFEIINGGYQNLNIKHMINEEYSSINMNVKYLNGSNLGVTKKSIAIQLSFKSEKPISFTMKIDFYDHHNRVFSIYVSGTADNSMYALTEQHWNPDTSQEIARSASFIINFLNAIGFVDDILYDFPACMTANDFENYQRLLEYLDPQAEKLDKQRVNPKKANALEDIYEYVSETIKMLKSEGAFLNEIRPQFLFSEGQFNQLLKTKSQNPRIYTNYKQLSSEQFRELRTKSWIIVIYQILKVNSRVSSKKKNSGADFWTQMLQKEKTIINWLEQTYQAEAGLEEQKSSSDLSTLDDGEMLSALITKYTNIKVLESYGKPCYNYKEKEKRCRKIIEIFGQVGIVPGVRAEDLLRSKPIEMLVFLDRLYMILPYYLQKGDPVIFSCLVGQSLTKSIEIKNPSKYAITYVAKIEGSKSYVIQNQTQFVIESKQKHQVLVKYISNIDVDKANGTLTLTGKASSKFTPSTFIFVLRSNSLGRISEKNIQITGQLYQPYEFQLPVKNNFPVDTLFNIEITSTSQKISAKNLYCTNPIVKIKKDETVPISFVFFPFIMQTHRFQILFRDPKVGEFQYDIIGLVDMPQVTSEAIRLGQTFYTNKSYTVEVPLPQKNEDILRARKQIEVYWQKAQRKAQTQLGAQIKKPPSSLQQPDKTIYPTLKNDTYSLSLVPQTEMVVLKTPTLSMDPEQDEGSFLPRKIILQVNMKMPVKDAALYLVMKNSSNNDVRRYKLLVNSAFKPLRYELEMKIPVNQTITQALPLINVSNEPSVFNVTFTTNENTNSRTIFGFNNLKDFVVKGKQQLTVSLTFSPKMQQAYTGVLKIENITVGQIIEYEVNGYGEEPVADTLKFQQNTSEVKRYEVKIPYSKPQKCSVTKCAFSPANIKYDRNFLCTSESNSVFKFDFASKIPGTFEGKIYIEDETKIHAFNITISVIQSVAGIIELRSTEREKKSISVYLEKGNWSVDNNDNNLIIPKQFSMPANGEYTFSYVGSKAGQFQNELVFKSDTAFVKYLLRITVEEQPEVEIGGLEAELGKTESLFIQLENPDNEAITVSADCTNPDTFYYEPHGPFVIAAKSKRQITFIYRPSSLEEEKGKIHFTSSSNLKWKYELSGIGKLQADQEVTEISAQVGEEVVKTVTFKNPFKNDVLVYTFLEDINDPKTKVEDFKLVTKSNKHSLRYLEQVQIPVQLTPAEVRTYSCKVKILINERVYWKYVINVRTICRVEEQIKAFKLPARAKKEHSITFALPHFNIKSENLDKVTCILAPIDPGMANQLKGTVRLNKQCQNIIDNKVTFALSLQSFRPFTCPFNFQLYLDNNCKWIYKSQVEFSVPAPDDQFEIVTDINKATSVIFKLNNRVKAYAKYKAYFTSDSDMEFSISPKAGDLEPYGREGTQFEVTFAPTQYRTAWHGKIVIETEDSFWSYAVKGNLPHYVPPVGKSNLATSTFRKI